MNLMMQTFSPAEPDTRGSRYDEFCLVSNFIVDPLQSVDLLPMREIELLPALVIDRIQQRKRKRKNNHVDTVPG